MDFKVLIKNIFYLSIFFVSLITAQAKPYVILVSFDGFRWDYANRNITPNLDLVKSNGVTALSLRPTFPSKTFPNHWAIITGMYNDHHGIIANKFLNPFTKEVYRLGDTVSVRDSKWYLGEPFWQTAERNGIKTASYFWPGSEVNDKSKRPTYFKKYEHNKPYKERIDGVINWLQLPQKDRPHFITLYFHDTDSYGHAFGPNSTEVNKSIKRLDLLVGYFTEELSKINLIDSTNIIFVSDHGMTEISLNKVVHIDDILVGYKYSMQGEKPFALIEPSKEDFEKVYTTLKKNENHYKTYLKKELPKYYHYSENPFIPSIILVADLGWSLVNGKWFNAMKKANVSGNHGYDNNHTDMHGLFIAQGPNLKNGYKTGTLWNIDIYPMLCKIFDIEPRANIDGRLERIEFILK